MWIRDYRERNKLELWQFQQRVNDYGKQMEIPLYGTVSAQLIHMLEVDENAVTHPRIADAIAVLCGATSKQRDMIVAKIHHGEYNPTEEEIKLAKENNSKLFVKGVDYHAIPKKQKKTVNLTPYRISEYKSEVVKIDEYGKVLERYKSLTEAAKMEGTHRSCVSKRCKRKILKEFGIFNNQKNKMYRDFTFRFAREWDEMSIEQRIADINRTKERVVK